MLFAFRRVLLAVPVCLGGVVLVARPTFIFGGQSLSLVGVIIGIFQARSPSGPCPDARK